MIEHRLYLQPRFDNKLEPNCQVWDHIWRWMKTKYPAHRFLSAKSLETAFNTRATAQRWVPVPRIRVPPWPLQLSATKKLRIVILGFGTGRFIPVR
jgi:hypothetical protein